MLARTMLRAAAKYAAAEAAEEKKGRTGKLVAGVAGALFEHADTRSWHILPSDISIARIALPAGRYRLSVRLAPSAADDAGRAIELGEVEVVPGRLLLVPTRLWPDLTTTATVSRHN
jgi:hypothetical protein